MIICGKQAIDGDTAQVGPGIARRLGLPQLTYVKSITGIDQDNHRLTVHRKLEDGYEVVEVKMPCLLTVEK